MKQRIRAFLAAGVLAVLSSGGASSGTLDDAIAASKRGDKAAALQLFKAAADQGDAVGQLIVGGIYEDGTVVPRNCGESQKWLHKAADQDLTAQQTTDAKFAVVAARQELAHLYGWDGGFCVTRDVAESGKWALKAAEGGELRGLIELAQMYTVGHGAPQDYAEEAKWYREAAQHGAEPQWAREAMAGKDASTENQAAYAQENLGWMYYLGKGVPKDLVTAHMWLNLAAAHGDAQAAVTGERCGERLRRK